MSVLSITLRGMLACHMALDISFTAATVENVLRPYQAPGSYLLFR